MTVSVSVLLASGAALAQTPTAKDVLEQDAPETQEVQATESEEGQASETTTPQGPQDELNRGTPRTSVIGLTNAVRQGDYETASRYLDLEDPPWQVQGIEAVELARQLKVILDRGLWIDTEKLSINPEGLADDGLPRDTDSLGRVETDGGVIDIYVQRVPRDDGVMIWKISSATVGRIPALYEIYGYGVLGEKLSKIMPDFAFLGLSTWQWIILAGLAIVCYLIALPPTWLAARILRRSRNPLSQEFARFIAGPFRFLIAVLLVRSWIDLIHPGVTARAWIEGSTVLVIVLAWTLIHLVGVFQRRWADALRAKGRGQAVVLMRPAANALKILIVVLAVLLWLENLGFDATTLIAGLGIGGLAFALAAQKSVENLIGAITLFSSAPVRVGDFCRFGDTSGTVEEIGLRATKLRTLASTVVHVPNAAFADMNLENFSERESVLYRPKIGLRYDTTPDQLRYVLVEIRTMLYSHPRIDPEPARVRFMGFGDSSLDLEIMAYVTTTAWGEYLEIAEDLNLRIMDIVEQAGAEFAYPTQTISIERAKRSNGDAARAAEDKVNAWREQGELCLPEFPDDRIRELRGTLNYPPTGSATSTG